MAENELPVIPDLPPAPLRNDPEEAYAEKSSNFVGAMNPWGQAINAAGAWVQAALQTVLSNVGLAAQASQDAQNAATDAGDYANNAAGAAGAASSYAQIAEATANFRGEWASLSGSLAVPASVYHNGAYWQLLRDISNVAASEPGVSSDWAGTNTEVVSWTSISTSTTLSPNSYYAVNFPASPITLTLPDNPANNDRIQLYRSSGDATGSVIDGNGKTVMGTAQISIDANIGAIDLIYNGTEWRVNQ